MRLYSSYKVKISKHAKAFRDTVRLYRSAVDFMIAVCMEHFDDIAAINGQKARVMYVESLTHKTSGRPVVPYDFDKAFYKFPSYLRRAAIMEAAGKVFSYGSNLANWEDASPAERGERPSPPKAGFVFPAMYKDNCYVRVDDYTAKIKVFVRNTWDWVEVRLRKSDADYITRHCAGRKECVPTLRKRGKCWYLVFAFEERVTLNDTHIFDTTIAAVDLGINSSCTVSIMRPDGTVLGRHFLSLPGEYDCLMRRLGRVRRAQHHGSKSCRGLWRLVDNANKDIAAKTAQFIERIAVLYNVDVIVFEHLDLQGKKRGRGKQRLHLWRARAVQNIVTDKAHRLGVRISRVNAWNTSRLAFDGSGRVKRGRESDKTNGCYSLCEFTTGKVYNCDLNASYNIGARYFIREILKSLPVTDGQRIQAKVPACAKRSTCTLSTLISMNAGLCAAA